MMRKEEDFRSLGESRNCGLKDFEIRFKGDPEQKKDSLINIVARNKEKALSIFDNIYRGTEVLGVREL